MTYETIVRIIADGAVIPVILIGAYMLVFKIPKGRRFESYSRVLLAGLTAYLVAKLAASIYQPSTERPFELLGAQAGASFLNNPGFPSDHTLFVTAIACAVWFETKSKLISFILAGLVVLICVGRVLALVHTPADVIFGVVFGLVGALWYLDYRPRSSKLAASLRK